MDVPACISAVAEFRDLCIKINTSAMNNAHNSVLKPIESEILARTPQVKAIAAAVGIGQPADYSQDRFLMSDVPVVFHKAEDAATQLLGHLERLEETEAMLGPSGPNLAAERLHPWVWDAAANLWDGGHYRNAVQDAYTAVEQQARLKSGFPKTGYETWEVFRPSGEENQVRLRLPDIDRTTHDKDWRSAHQGAAAFGEGCASNMRNLAAHSTGQFHEQEALEQLAALSYLARLVDRATVQQPTATD